ncbi:MAG: hypothetical protein H7Y86_10370 [Rhizobacter sp.]|nr:hypothetical protein [Ferruginibacter sp.]
MKTILLLSFFGFVCPAFAQKMLFQNDIVYTDGKPVAIFKKKTHGGDGAMSIDVFSTGNKLLVQLVAKKMKAPIRELASFYYHDIIFPSTRDSLSVYNPGEALSLHLFSLIDQYKLIQNQAIDSSAVEALKKGYSQKRFDDKINQMVQYLEDTRNYHNQVERDRTKPVYILNEKNIMQDSVLIGRFVIADMPVSENFYRNSSLLAQTEQSINPRQNIDVLLKSGHIVDKRFYMEYFPGAGQRLLGSTLYKQSKPKNMSDGNYYAKLLGLACCLIENYAL